MKKNNPLRVLNRSIYLCFLPLWLIMGILEVAERYFTGVVVQWSLEDINKLSQGIAILAVLFLVNYLLSCFGQFALSLAVENKILKVREKLFDNIINVSYDRIEKMSRGELLTKLMQNLKKIQDFETDVLPGFVRGVTQGVLALVVCVLISPILSLALILSIPLIIVVNVLASAPAQPLIEKKNDIEAEQNTYAQNHLEGIRSIKIFSMEERVLEGFRRFLKKGYRQDNRIASLRAVLTIMDGVNYILPYVIIFGGATILALKGKLEVGEIVSFTYLMNFITGCMGNIQEYMYERREMKDAVRRVNEILELEMPVYENTQENNEGKAEGRPGEICLTGVCFGYEENTDYVLKDIELYIHKGEKVAIVGESGSGKSTLLKLISGLYRQQKGKIYIGSGNTACIDQDNFLLPVSVADNIKGAGSASEKDIQRAAVQAGIDTFIRNLPEGYDTVPDIKKLSGGEMQRICIARSYAQNAEILLLDEPTSSLDRVNEELLWQEIRRMGKDKTIVMVTHSLRDMEIFDRICVMQDGRIVEEGTHQELCSREGKYSDLWKRGGGAA